MTSGAAVGLGVAAVGVGAVGWWLLRPKQPDGSSVTLPPPPPPSSGGGTSFRNDPAGAAFDLLQDVNQKACTLIAGGKVGKNLAAAGCSAYGKYLSPIGGPLLALHLVEKIPVIGGPIRSTEKAVVGVAKDVAKLPLTMVQHPMVIGSTALKVAAAPLTVARAGTRFASNALGIADSALGAAPAPVRAAVSAAAAPLVLAGKSLTLPVHMAAAIVQHPVDAIAGVVKSPVKAVTTIVAAPVKAIASVAKALKFW